MCFSSPSRRRPSLYIPATARSQVDWRAVRPPSLLTVRWSGEARRHVGSSGRTRRPDCAVDGHGLPLSGADENDVPVRRHRLFACSSSARLLLHAYQLPYQPARRLVRTLAACSWIGVLGNRIVFPAVSYSHMVENHAAFSMKQ